MARKQRRTKSSFGATPSGTVRPSTWLSRLFFLCGLIGVFGGLLGFVWFGDYVASLKTPTTIAKADGAAVLTGSDARLKQGVALLEDGTVPRLLISGVNTQASADDVRLVAGGTPQSYSCCIELGRAAVDTVGNASEITDWAKRYRVSRLILITDNYHMPRSLFEVSRANPGITIIPYPVSVSIYADKNWWKSDRARRGLALEYGKFIVAAGRAFIGDLLGTPTS